MAPIKDETVQNLKDLVAQLESRIRSLEFRLGGGGPKAVSHAESMRMILMGPPGAGVHAPTLSKEMLTLTTGL